MANCGKLIWGLSMITLTPETVTSGNDDVIIPWPTPSFQNELHISKILHRFRIYFNTYLCTFSNFSDYALDEYHKHVPPSLKHNEVVFSPLLARISIGAFFTPQLAITRAALHWFKFLHFISLPWGGVDRRYPRKNE